LRNTRVHRGRVESRRVNGVVNRRVYVVAILDERRDLADLLLQRLLR